VSRHASVFHTGEYAGFCVIGLAKLCNKCVTDIWKMFKGWERWHHLCDKVPHCQWTWRSSTCIFNFGIRRKWGG